MTNTNYHQKYLKYRDKYLRSRVLLSKQNLQWAGASNQDKMPSICLGTVPHGGNCDLLIQQIEEAFRLGYRHIDGADAYAGFAADYYNKMNQCFSSLTKTYGRENYWITWKSDQATEDNIQEIIKKLGCGYLDLFLVHHGCGSPKVMECLVRLRDQEVCHQIGVSNCYDMEKLREYKEKYDIFSNQIQAQPPDANIILGLEVPDYFPHLCNSIGINLMFYSPISGILNQVGEYYEQISSVFRIFGDENPALLPLNALISWYAMTYLLDPTVNNVLMIGTASGKTLLENYQRLTTRLTDSEYEKIANLFGKIKLANQS